MDCVIIGGGTAGMAVAAGCRTCWPDKSVMLVDAEKEVGYYRTLLPHYMAETLTEKKLFFPSTADDPLLTLRTGCRVRALDRDGKNVVLDDGEIIEYEKLVLAVGGRPIVPPIFRNTTLKGIHPVRYLTDARPVRKGISKHPQVVVLGGGLVGVKTATHFAHAGHQVTVVEREPRLLPMALSETASKLVETHLESLGIKLVLGCSIDAVKEEKGSIGAVQAGDEWLDCRLLLLAAGSVPDIEFLDKSGLLTDGGLMVTPSLQTQDKDIFALGDAITIQDGDGMHTPWTWPQAVSQGKQVAANLFFQSPIPIRVATRVNAMNLFGLSLIVLGAPVPGADVISFAEPNNGVYRELFVVDDRIVGGALVGDISNAGPLHAMMIAGERIEGNRADLIKPHGKAFPGKSWNDLNQNRRAWFIPMEERVT